MRGLRITIAGSMALVLVLALAFASLHEPTDLWARGLLTLALAAAGLALLGALVARGPARAGWTGALVLGGGYLALCVGPWSAEHLMPRLLLTEYVDRHYARMSYRPAEADERLWAWRPAGHHDGQYVEAYTFGSISDVVDDYNISFNNGGTTRLTSAELRPLSPEAFRQLVHADLSLALFFVGAILGRLIAGRPADREADHR